MDTTIIFIHGFGSSPEGRKSKFLEEFCKKANINFAAVDLTPLPEDFTEMNVTNLLKRVNKTIKQNLDNKIILAGSSLGGYLSILSCKTHCSINGMILFAPAVSISDLKSYSDEELEKWRKNGFKTFYLKKFDKDLGLNFNFINSILDNPIKDTILNKIPVLIFQGKNDTIVDTDDVIYFSNRQFNSTLHILDSDHKLHNQFQFIEEKLAEYLQLFR